MLNSNERSIPSQSLLGTYNSLQLWNSMAVFFAGLLIVDVGNLFLLLSIPL